jgi:hypothetical protein
VGATEAEGSCWLWSETQLLKSSGARASGTHGSPPCSPLHLLLPVRYVHTYFHSALWRTATFVRRLDQYKIQHVMPRVYLFLCSIVVLSILRLIMSNG